jgi:hypothetical protein
MPAEPELPLVVAYLGVLRTELSDDTDVDCLLDEAEAHLRESTARGLADGLPIEAAQRAALARFGRIQTVADAVRGATRQPLMYDARDGLPKAAIGGLLHASRLALLLRDGHTAALGYWIDDSFAGALLVRRRDARDGALPATTGIRIGTVDTRVSAAWRNVILPALHDGMLIHAEVWAGQPRLWFGPILGSTQSVGSLSATQISLAFPTPGSGGLRHVQVRLH